eukprot:m.405871 g.405871  ORF g.405871 m.405871 type:complete len:55 (+) comp16795_c3_seq38:122-286(+)
MAHQKLKDWMAMKKDKKPLKKHKRYVFTKVMNEVLEESSVPCLDESERASVISF